MSQSFVLIPRMSEKAYGVSKAQGTYVFSVDRAANKHTVARAVSDQYNVTVTEVNIVNQHSKPKRTVRKGSRPTAGSTNEFKKAYVTVKSGQSIPLFAAIEAEQEKETKVQEKLDKAAAKAAEKEAKQEAKQVKKAGKADKADKEKK